MAGTREVGLHPCSQPISSPAGSGAPDTTLGQLEVTLGEAGRGQGPSDNGDAWGHLGSGAHRPAGGLGEAIWLSSPGEAQHGEDDIWS